MPKAYWIAIYHSISNPAALSAYGELAGPAIKAAGGASSRAILRQKLSNTASTNEPS